MNCLDTRLCAHEANMLFLCCTDHHNTVSSWLQNNDFDNEPPESPAETCSVTDSVMREVFASSSNNVLGMIHCFANILC